MLCPELLFCTAWLIVYLVGESFLGRRSRFIASLVELRTAVTFDFRVKWGMCGESKTMKAHARAFIFFLALLPALLLNLHGRFWGACAP